MKNILKHVRYIDVALEDGTIIKLNRLSLDGEPIDIEKELYKNIYNSLPIIKIIDCIYAVIDTFIEIINKMPDNPVKYEFSNCKEAMELFHDSCNAAYRSSGYNEEFYKEVKEYTDDQYNMIISGHDLSDLSYKDAIKFFEHIRLSLKIFKSSITEHLFRENYI